MFLAGHPSQGCFGLQSHCAPCYFFNQASFYPSDFSFNHSSTYWSGRGSLVVKVTDSLLLHYEFEPSTTKDLLCSLLVKSVEDQASSRSCSVEVERGGASSGSYSSLDHGSKLRGPLSKTLK
ncbi:hypothetical protein TNCV_438851 [Trichonephila clavipes]|nr:hypothetical protein TNCV_438851 [Trichonephila clavipes]